MFLLCIYIYDLFISLFDVRRLNKENKYPLEKKKIK